MEVQYVVSELSDFGDSKVADLESGNVVFQVRTEISSVEELENLTQRLDNLRADVKATGNRGDVLFIIRIDSNRFDQIPPYLYEGWRESTDRSNFQ